MIFTQKAAREKIQSLESRVTELESELKTASEREQALQNEVADAQAESAPLQVKVSELTEEIEGLNKSVEELQTENADLTTKCENIQKQVASQVVTELAQTGVEKPLEVSGTTQSKEEILAEFKAMSPGPERSAFFAKHKAILSINS